MKSILNIIIFMVIITIISTAICRLCVDRDYWKESAQIQRKEVIRLRQQLKSIGDSYDKL